MAVVLRQSLLCFLTATVLFIILVLVLKRGQWEDSSPFSFAPVRKPQRLEGVNILTLEQKPHNFHRAILAVGQYVVPIFVHGPHDYISKSLLNGNGWENGWLIQLMSFMRIHYRSQLIDLGCNIGVYSLVVATFGRPVISIDANKNNTDLLTQSVVLGNLQDRVTVILNAVSNERKQFSMDKDEANVGAQAITNIKGGNTSNIYVVKSILMDDLIPLTTEAEEIVIKMDIQGSEINSFKGAAKFFAQRNVIAILIEWVLVKEDAECYILIDFLMSRGFRPYSDFFSNTELKAASYKEWPYDVVWRKT